MTYLLAASGLGHWVRRLQATLEERGNQIKLYKAAGTRSYEARREELERYGIPRERYFSLAPESALPDEFFEGVDIVYIASPNSFHKSQTEQSIRKKKVTVTEKALAVNRSDFEEITSLIRREARDRVTVGLHYLTKALTTELGRRLDSLTASYGKIRSVSATFFEETREEDARREWLFKPENGGIAMDWIHPISIISHTMKAERMVLQQGRGYILQPMYDKVYPTGFLARYKVTGEYFADGSEAVIRVGKGLNIAHKVMRLQLEEAMIDLIYISTDEELTTGSRGEMKIAEKGGEVVMVRPSGPLSYEPMLDDMLRMVRGQPPSLSVDDIVRIYDPEWQLQDAIAVNEVVKDRAEIEHFVSEGLSHRV
ncbi:MAG: Gfo/Idh/MocA family oxidoreductase [Conexivisphaerales archaeon]